MLKLQVHTSLWDTSGTKVTFIGSVNNSCDNIPKGRFNLSCLETLNSFSLMLLTFLLICTLKVGSEHYATLTDCASLKVYVLCLNARHSYNNKYFTLISNNIYKV